MKEMLDFLIILKFMNLNTWKRKIKAIFSNYFLINSVLEIWMPPKTGESNVEQATLQGMVL